MIDGRTELFNRLTSALIVVQQSTLSCHLNLNPFHPSTLQYPPQVRYQLRIVNLAKRCRILLQLRQRFGELRAPPIPVPMAEVMHPDCRLDQTLVIQAEGAPGRPPQVLPCLVGFKIPSSVKKNYSRPEEIGHAQTL
jgi:hypothetical protein